MNAPIYRLFVLFVVLFAVLVGFSSRWAVFGATALRENPDNHRVIIEEQQVKRGVIRADDGAVLAGSTSITGDRYTRRYPTGKLFALAVGYDNVRYGRAGLEKYYNDQLVGNKAELTSLIDSLGSKKQVGDDLQTNLDPKAQKVATQLMQGHKGAIVALGVKDGAVKVMVGTPSFDPLHPEVGSTFNTATQGLYPPGSTFKTVTATAALDTGKYQPDSKVSGANGKKIDGIPLNNFGGEQYGDITLTDALTHSVNTVWAEVGVKLGALDDAEVHAPLRVRRAAADGLSTRPDERSAVRSRAGRSSA